MQYFSDANKEDYDEDMKKFMEILASICDNIIENINNIFHHILISSPYNDVEDDGLSEITMSTSKTKLYKSYPSSFWKPT